MPYIDDKKVNDMIPQTWIIEYLKIFKISELVVNFHGIAMELTAVEGTLAEVKIQKRHLLEELRTAITLSYNKDAVKLYPKKM